MTNEEARMNLEKLLQIYDDPGIIDFTVIVESIKMALEALEKQIPKKVRITTSTKRCAVCGRQLSGIGNMHPTRLYCQKCGQAIDWTEDE